MPLLKIQTNVAASTDDLSNFLKKASRTAAGVLGKSERYVMVSVESNPAMLFAGGNEPLAYVELKSIGLPEDQTGQLSAALCALLESDLAIAPDRVYIEFADAAPHMWGWNGATF